MNTQNNSATFSPLVLDSANELRRQIREVYSEPNAWLPGENELATLLDISRGTLRKVISMMIEHGEIERNANGRLIKSVKSANPKFRGRVYVWVFDQSPSYTKLLMKGINEVLMGTGVEPVFQGCEPVGVNRFTEQQEHEFISHAAKESDCLGVLTWRGHNSAPMDAYRQIRAKDIPLIFCAMAPPPGLLVDHVGVANRTSAFYAVMRMKEFGHHNIACFSDGIASALAEAERTQGYRDAMAHAGLQKYCRVLTSRFLTPSRDSYVGDLPFWQDPTLPYDWELEQTTIANDLTEQYMQLPDRPTAVFSVFDERAEFSIPALRRARVRVPEMCSVVGIHFDPSQMRGAHGFAAGMVMDSEEVGRRAAKLVLDRICRKDRLETFIDQFVAPFCLGETLTAPPEPCAVSPEDRLTSFAR